MHIMPRLAALAILGAGTIAFAQQPLPPRAGGRTLAQFQARARARMMRFDTNHDGRISLSEFQAGMSGGSRSRDPSRAFERADVNHDGFVDQGEMDAMSAKRFARRDANRDGVLTADERPARSDATAPRR